MPRTHKLLKRLQHMGRRRPPYLDGNGNRQVHQRIPPRIVPLGDDPPDNPPRHDSPVILDVQAHTPHDLVDTAINSFTNHKALSAAQISAKRFMVRYLLRSMTSRPPRIHRRRNLYIFAKWADTFFFQGTLTGATPNNSIIPLEYIFSARPQQEADGHFFVLEGIRLRRRTIRVNETRLRQQEPWAFQKGATFAALLRVLARMYLTLYGCVCDEHGCFRKIPSTYGITGQGYCWQVLMSFIILEIRSWDYRLRDFANHRAGAHGIDAEAGDREQQHWGVLTQTEEWRDLVDGLHYPAVGAYGLEFQPELRAVKRRGKKLMKEAENLRREAAPFLPPLEAAMRGRRVRRRPQRYGFN